MTLSLSDTTVTKLDFDKGATPPPKRHPTPAAELDEEEEEPPSQEKIPDGNEVQVMNCLKYVS